MTCGMNETVVRVPARLPIRSEVSMDDFATDRSVVPGNFEFEL
jgi:hypothetical protein